MPALSAVSKSRSHTSDFSLFDALIQNSLPKGSIPILHIKMLRHRLTERTEQLQTAGRRERQTVRTEPPETVRTERMRTTGTEREQTVRTDRMQTAGTDRMQTAGTEMEQTVRMDRMQTIRTERTVSVRPERHRIAGFVRMRPDRMGRPGTDRISQSRY